MAGLEGKTLDRYELRQLTGRGGMADVYRAFDTVFGREVAVKVFKRDDDDLLRRFVREARLMASLHHPHLMPIYDTGEASIDGIVWYYIVMPFMTGGTLRARIRRGPLALSEACRILSDIADALDYVHQKGIIHRDIKSSNVLLDADGNCYLADFGIARTTSDATQLTSTGNVLGTADYVAPELFEPHRRANELSDQYSLGVLAFEMITGRPPFSADSQLALAAMHVSKQPPAPSSIVATIPSAVDRVILRVLAKQPEQRYASATEFAEAFCRATRATTKRLTAAAGNGVLVAPVSPLYEAAPDEPTVLAAPPRVAAPARPGSRSDGQLQRAVSTPRMPVTSRKRPTAQQRQLRVLTVLAFVALLAVAGPIIYVLLTYNHGGGNTPGPVVGGNTTTATQALTPTNTPDLTATAMAQSATATVQAQEATATAIAGATATVIAQATAQAQATAGVIQTATAGQPSYSDPLNNVNNPQTQAANWDQTSNCQFKSDGYHVTSSFALQGCQETAYTYQNATITVDVTINSGHSGGLFFRTQTSSILHVYSGYLFEIDANGDYKISRSKDFSNPLDLVTLQDWTASSALKTGTATNKLEVIMNGGVFLLYANGVFLTEIQDTTYSAAGTVAFLANGDGASADITYSNLNVYPLA
jgi:serine/threonine protein kinase